MNKLLYTLFLSIFLFDYLSGSLGSLGRYITWFPELLSILTILIISGLFMLGGLKDIPPKCLFFLALFLLNIIIGIVVNLVSAGPMIAGIRAYLKFIPFFILPFVYHFSNEQINGQLKLLLSLFIIQTPIALYQRLILSKELLTGDLVRGTVNGSGQLTIVLSCAIAVLISFYLSKKISLRTVIIIFLWLFIPMTINETKSTLIFLPIALMLPSFLSANGLNLKQLIPITILGVFTAFAFIFIYDYYISQRWGYGIIDFLTMEGRATQYLYKGDDSAYVEQVGRVDSWIIAFKTISENIINMFFGLGIGNVSESFIPGLSGEYAEEYSRFNVKISALTLILWELGLFGVILYYALYLMIFKDSRRLSINSSIIGVLSLGWSTVIVILMIATMYTNFFLENTTAYLFWYFSGVIISENFRYTKRKLCPIK